MTVLGKAALHHDLSSLFLFAQSTRYFTQLRTLMSVKDLPLWAGQHV
jgi:hypothetical protein